MLSLIKPPSVVESDGDDGGDAQNRYVVIAENIDRKFLIISYVNAKDEQACRTLTMRWFLKTDHGVPTKCTIYPVSDEIEYINITSNDEDVCEYLGIDMPEERTGKA
jgi:hypothetical protein